MIIPKAVPLTEVILVVTQNQEIHPVYSIDVINYPYRPEDTNTPGATDLTGTYGGSDGSTYYVRQTGSTNIHQLGRTIWWLGLMRDRQPMQRGTNFPMIGSNQRSSCSSRVGHLPMSLKEQLLSPPGETIIEGDWAGVPQSTFAGSSGGHMKFVVFNHKIIIPETPGIFPLTIEKMYDPPGFGGAGVRRRARHALTWFAAPQNLRFKWIT